MTGEVLSARRGRGHARHGLEELWTRVQSRGWLDDAAPRVVIQVGNAGADRLLADTVHGLAAFLRSRMGVSHVDVLDLHGGDWTPLRRLGMPPADVVEIAGIAEARVTVPRLWLEPFFLVTIAAIAGDPAARLRGVLAAQADPLRHVGWRASRASRVYEAHRLGGSDLAIACGAAGGEAWWLASPSDVAVDRVVAQAAGLDPARLPDVRAVARHEEVPALALVEELPGVREQAAPAWRAALTGARDGVVSTVRFVAQDARAVRRNIGRVPHALRRRLPALRRRGGNAA